MRLQRFGQAGDEIPAATDEDGSTKTMVRGVALLIHSQSQFMTPVNGDMISAGTPLGAGLWQQPQVYLKEGQAM